MEKLLSILGTDVYDAQATCLANDRIVMTLFAAFDLGTMVAYSVIGLAVILHASKITKVSTQALRLYGVFFLLCVLYRASCILTLFVGVVRLKLLIDGAIFGASATIAVFTVMRLRELFTRQAMG